MKYRCKYEYTNDYYAKHIWSVEGANGGIHLHITDLGEKITNERYSGGIEYHYRTPPDYMKEDAPSHHNCFLLGGPCWHDGSSLQASEYWVPLWEMDQGNHDLIFSELQKELEKK